MIEVREEVEDEVPHEITELAQRRWEAKSNKDWATADQIRDELLQEGWVVKDSKEGFTLAKSLE